ncbi:hypothetical protein [Arthrobacter glacialis]|uniref:YtxH domain-containing protein n=1 Tax=Arthrobacter glacialis TaxID=1664 RepID=A0A2S3ZUA8_ARTGL|nr:hypothetical protein [Arthrobacter glacialis]POH57284.1 hypothetical protein CVS28_16975 [Arthrobacter glacialis]POH72427.1 hypothetical protein CVS27_16235 [Arthrobacter glacialis]
MKAKLTFLAGMAAGYVLGSRAGRTSYEKIKACATSIWNKDSVQETVTTVQHAVREHAVEAAHKLLQHTKHTGASTETGHVDADPGNTGGKPLDIAPEVSDEFPDAALSGGEAQKWGKGRMSGS